MAGRSLLLLLVLEGIWRSAASESAFVSLAVYSRGRGAQQQQQRARHYTCDMQAGGGGGEGRSSTATKAVAAGLLGLQLLGMPLAVVGSRQARSGGGATLAELEVVVSEAGARAPQTTQEELIGEQEVEKLELKTEVEGNLKKQSNTKRGKGNDMIMQHHIIYPAPLPDELKTPAKGKESPRVKLVVVSSARLTKSVETIQGLSPYLDEVEYLITARSWDYLKGFLGVFASCEEDFVSLIDGMYPTEKPADVSARDSMQLEAQNVFLAVDDLYQASMSKKVKSAEKAYVKLALAYDRFMKAGDISPIYDPVSSTEKFFNDIPDDMLRYERNSKVPLDIRDAVLVLKGPDKGRTGKIVGIINSRNEAIVRMDGTTREMRILELTDIARQLPDDPKMAAAAAAAATGTGGTVKKK
ncbi:unnamed protein product [Laminaria digitata]